MKKLVKLLTLGLVLAVAPTQAYQTYQKGVTASFEPTDFDTVEKPHGRWESHLKNDGVKQMSLTLANRSDKPVSITITPRFELLSFDEFKTKTQWDLKKYALKWIPFYGEVFPHRQIGSPQTVLKCLAQTATFITLSIARMKANSAVYYNSFTKEEIEKHEELKKEVNIEKAQIQIRYDKESGWTPAENDKPIGQGISRKYAFNSDLSDEGQVKVQRIHEIEKPKPYVKLFNFTTGIMVFGATIAVGQALMKYFDKKNFETVESNFFDGSTITLAPGESVTKHVFVTKDEFISNISMNDKPIAIKVAKA